MDDSAHPTGRVPDLVRKLYAVVAELEALFPGRAFTPDGHLVGSIGEVVAAHKYGLTLYSASTGTHDAFTADREVQIKVTQGTSVALRAEPQHLIVLHLGKDGETTEVFNGPGRSVWSSCGKVQKNGQRPISLSTLRKLMHNVAEQERLKEIFSQPTLE